jgi:hypothetical protein
MFRWEFVIWADERGGYNHAVDLNAKSRAGGRWRLWAAVVAVWALAELAGARSWVDELAGMHAPDEYEQFMEFAAEETNAPLLCAKIPWSAYSRGGWDSAAAYAKSECYEAVARNTGSPWLCLSVKRLGSPAILRQQTSMFSCLEGVHSRHGMGAGVGPPTRLHFFQAMGYSPDTIQDEGVIGPLIRVKDLYRGLSDRYGLQIGRNASGNATVLIPGTLSKDELMRRIERVIGGRDAPLPADGVSEEDAAYLADLGAMTSKDAGWCGKIPPGLPLTGEPEGFRNRCFFKVAVKTKHATLCDRILVHPSLRDARLGLQAECRREIGSKLQGWTHYGPAVPADENEVRVLLKLLHVDVPSASSLPDDQIEAAYQQFVFDLGHPRTPQQAAARQRFIARAEALRDETLR